MIEKLIELSVKNRFLLLIFTLIIIGSSIWSMKNTALDALPDISPPQVILQIKWAGQSPDIIDQQGTYPLITALLSTPNIKTVRGFSSYENALIYIIFKEGSDIYEARSRVLEQLSSIGSTLPQNMQVSLGPDASGVGWVYEYALSSKTKNLAQLRTLQDYYYKNALLGVEGVSEVATIGGFIPTYQVSIKNDMLVRYDLGIQDIAKTLKQNNDNTGGRIVVKNGYEWMVQAKGYVHDLDEIRDLVITTKDGMPVTLGNIARVEKIPASRRGMADLNGEGEVVGGIVIVRYGADVYRTIQNVKKRLKFLETQDVKITTTYDRSSLIDKAVDTLKHTLFEESLIVIIVIALFLMHLRSSLIVLIVLPITIGMTFLLMKLFGIGSNIMSLGGIAIAIGAMVDASIIMIENAHQTLFKLQEKGEVGKKERIAAIIESSQLVGRPIFFALVLVVVSFLPIFSLSGQEGMLFSPLAFTKTFAMSAGAILAITLVPVLMIYFLGGKIPSEEKNILNRFFTFLYHPLLTFGLRFKYIILILLLVSLAATVPLYNSLKWEFMPTLNEETFMYMPVTPYGTSIDLSKELTQRTDKILKSFPEVDTVFGKGGRADTATDPAPLGMLETIITFKPQSVWRKGMTYKKLQEEMESALHVAGLVNSWTYPIKGRIDMLLSGIRTPIGIKLYGNDSKKLQFFAGQIEQKLKALDMTMSVFADKTTAGYYLNIDIDEEALKRYNITKDTLLSYTSLAIGGTKISTLYKGLERYAITMRLEENERDSLSAIKNIMIKTPLGFVPLSTFAEVTYKESPSIIKSEMALPVTYIYITPKEGVSSSEYKTKAQEVLKDIKLPDGYYMEFAGENQYLESAMAKIIWIIPAVILIVLILIYFALKDAIASLIVFFTLPFALLGGLVFMYLLHFSMSIAVIVGFLALLGIASESAIVMIVYLQQSVKDSLEKNGADFNAADLKDAVYEGAVRRLRPKLMTVFAIIAGLLPIMYSSSVGSEIMQRIAAPMIGGIITSSVLSLLIIPILYEIYIKQKYIIK
ncbi:CusA/CzcA family heavy metal efflux RND transporter [bacterium]|nr:CusA/CzcA family heavy metal efflux RND transporter [bacterium]MBU1884072.1 CusA/CzcA family heavy metal efflux RND transporter [bacterium]